MKHEENVDLRKISRIAKIDSRSKVIQFHPGVVIGIKTWGRIDYLCNILGYHIVKSGIFMGDVFVDDNDKKHNREIKKQIKADKANSNMIKKNKKKK